MNIFRLAFAIAFAAHVFASAAGAVERSAWALDPAHTHIGFAVDATGFPRTKGEFRVFKGRLSVNLDKPALSHVAFTAQTGSIDVGSASFNGTLRGPAFLNSEKFPDIRFESTSVEKVDDKTARVTGDLTMLGVTLPLQVDVDVRRDAGGGKLGFTAHAHIDRLAFGMNSGFPVISRDVELIVSSEAVAQ
jgi:polyisoprenoid-binding protein YceI